MPVSGPLTPASLDVIKNHQYKGGEYTPIDLILNHFWAAATEYLPLWMAPNVVTLLGVAHHLVVYGVMYFYSPTFGASPTDERIPPLACILCAYCLFMYQTLDAMDGKQARRTGSSSPLGQLFDHGCDSFCNINHVAVMGCVLQCGKDNEMLIFYSLVSLQFCFFCAQWAERVTGTLNHQCGGFGVTEVQLGEMFFVAASGVAQLVTPGDVFNDPTLLHSVFQGHTLATVSVAAWLGFNALLLLVCIHTICTLEWQDDQTRTGVAMDLVPAVCLALLSMAWPTAFVKSNLRLLMIVTGLCFCQITNKIVVFSMAKQHFETVQPAAVVLAVCVAAVNYMPGHSADILKLCAVVMTVMFFHWCTEASVQIAEHLEIRVFTIVKKGN